MYCRITVNLVYKNVLQYTEEVQSCIHNLSNQNIVEILKAISSLYSKPQPHSIR